ncbi:MAG: class I SAM-dependent methyltransferase [Chloroflexi bacterium]|nr:class I SAM-dependent methyltransferase [Chloroflexota bacterium]
MPSLVFDQAVSFYDKTRADPEWVANAITDSLIKLGEITTRSRVLEIGIGTGRIALPALGRGIPITGIDLSRAMMAELEKKIAGQNHRVALVQADANGLPFRDAAFDCAYAVHVYHVVANWQRALRDAWRVVKPGGHLLVNYHDHEPRAVFSRMRAKLAEMARAAGVETRRPGAQSSDELRDELNQFTKTRVVEIARWHETVVPAQMIQGLAAKSVSETWLIPDDLLARLIPRVRAWAQAELGDLSNEIIEHEKFVWIISQKLG